MYEITSFLTVLRSSPHPPPLRTIFPLCIHGKGGKKKVDLYSAFIAVPHTQGSQVRITQCYLQITPYLHLPRKHSPDGASQTEVADI